jgi:pilus assembly protein CpaF
MRPDRIVIGEVRGDEAFDMLQAMNTGHEGSMTTIHANSCRDALSRLESMVAMANLNLPERAVRQQMASAITLVVQVSRLSDGSRKVVSIAEITGMDESTISMQDLFTFVKKGIGPNGRVIGTFQPTRIRPRFLERIRLSGILLSPELFERSMEVSE